MRLFSHFFFRFAAPGTCLLLALFSPTAPAAENEIVVISPNWEGIRDETARAFRAWHAEKYGAPVVIRWREVGGGTSQIVRFLRSEYQSSPSSGIDVFYGGGVDPYRDLKSNGLLARYDPQPEVLAQIPADLHGMPLYDPDHDWFGAALSGFGIIINERACAAASLPDVHAWTDLTDPRLAGWISGCDPRASGSVLTIDEIILQAYGWEKGWAILMEMSGNVRSFLSSAAAATVQVGLGDAAVGVSIDTYGQAQVGYYGPENVRFVLPEGETVITPDAIAVLKNPPHPELARHFLEFVLSRPGQLLWMLPKGTPGGAVHSVINRMSVCPALYAELAGRTPIVTDPFRLPTSMVYSEELGTKRRSILSALIAARMIDTHDVLVCAWNALHSAAAQKLSPALQEKLLAEFLAPPCTQDELLRVAATTWKDPVRHTALINGWQDGALDRYRRVASEVAAGKTSP
jgi:ABC-type Fe3+ transport system substrate-binding protein